MIRRAISLVVGFGLAGVSALEAQSSQFGIRGLGIPVRPISPRASAMGGALGLFDLESSQNPAAPGQVLNFTTLFTSANSFRSSKNAFGQNGGRDNRFPQIIATGPIGGTNTAAALSISGYTDRSYVLGTQDSIDLRGSRVGVFDTLSSRGGLSDIRLAGAWRVTPTFHVGLGLHAITGLTRIENRRDFGDSTYAPVVDRADVSYLGLGLSTGLTVRVTPRFTLAATYRNDGHLNVDRDTTRIARTDLPQSAALGIRWQPSDRVLWATSFQRKRWGTADRDLKAQGGIGAENSAEIATGIEIVKDPKNPGHRPWRFGLHYGTLPFPIKAGSQPREFGVALGTGIRFTQGRGGFDLTVQQLFRSDGAGATERATVVSLGLSIRP